MRRKVLSDSTGVHRSANFFTGSSNGDDCRFHVQLVGPIDSPLIQREIESEREREKIDGGLPSEQVSRTTSLRCQFQRGHIFLRGHGFDSKTFPSKR